VTRQIRPDWDLAVSGLRENWDAVDHSMHHPYQQADRNTTVRFRKLKFFLTERTVVPLPQRQEEPAMEYLVTMTTCGPGQTATSRGARRERFPVPALRGFGVEGSLPAGQRGGGGGLAAGLSPVRVAPV
jgi:hypothetical protein